MCHNMYMLCKNKQIREKISRSKLPTQIITDLLSITGVENENPERIKIGLIKQSKKPFRFKQLLESGIDLPLFEKLIKFHAQVRNFKEIDFEKIQFRKSEFTKEQIDLNQELRQKEFNPRNIKPEKLIELVRFAIKSLGYPSNISNLETALILSTIFDESLISKLNKNLIKEDYFSISREYRIAFGLMLLSKFGIYGASSADWIPIAKQTELGIASVCIVDEEYDLRKRRGSEGSTFGHFILLNENFQGNTLAHELQHVFDILLFGLENNWQVEERGYLAQLKVMDQKSAEKLISDWREVKVMSNSHIHELAKDSICQKLDETKDIAQQASIWLNFAYRSRIQMFPFLSISFDDLIESGIEK